MLAPHSRLPRSQSTQDIDGDAAVGLRLICTMFGEPTAGYDVAAMSAIDDSGPNTARSRRIRLPRPGILLAGTLLLTVAIGVLWILRAGQRQRAFVNQIEESGGLVETTPREPDWLRGFLVKILGEERAVGFDRIVALDLRSTRFSDDDLERVHGLMSLARLNLWGLYVGDDGMEHLRGLDSLEFLDISHTSVTDTGLEHLSRLGSLVELRLSFTRVTDAGLRHLHSVPTLKRIDLRGTQVSDAGVDELHNALRGCEILH